MKIKNRSLLIRTFYRIVQKKRTKRLAKKCVLFLTTFGFVIESVFSQSNLQPIIQISANVYEYRLEGEKQLGLFYEYNRKSGSVQSSDLFLPGTENTSDNPIGALDVSGSFTSFAYGSIDYNLKTAVEEGRATLINHQRAMVADGKDFQFTVGETIPVTVLSMVGVTVTLSTVEKATGVKLLVTPYIFRESNVLMNLEIESSEISRLNTFDRGDGQPFTLPVITKRNVKTVVIVPSERPVYVGGLYTDTNSDLTRKMPIIGDLPVIGFFVRGFNKKRKQTETIFRITPVIKAPGEGLDIGSSVFEELLQPEGDKTLIQQQGLRDAASSTSGIPLSASDVQSATGTLPAGDILPASGVISATGVLSATDALMIPSPIIQSATASKTETPSVSTKKRFDRSNRYGSSSKAWKR